MGPPEYVAVYFCAFIIIGSVLEERDLVANFGVSYVKYQQKVPMLVPWRIPGDD